MHGPDCGCPHCTAATDRLFRDATQRRGCASILALVALPLAALVALLLMGKHTAPQQKHTADVLSEWEQIWRSQNPDEWMEPLRHGGSRVEQRMRQTYRDRGLLLAKRVGRKARRLRQALARTRQNRTNPPKDQP